MDLHAAMQLELSIVQKAEMVYRRYSQERHNGFETWLVQDLKKWSGPARSLITADNQPPRPPEDAMEGDAVVCEPLEMMRHRAGFGKTYWCPDNPEGGQCHQFIPFDNSSRRRSLRTKTMGQPAS
eukprot:15018424-Heterocapsa_arctica.AAC.1